MGKRLRELREERGLTQKQVADALKIHSVTYLHYEKGQREPPLSLLADMAAFSGNRWTIFSDLRIKTILPTE